MSKARDRQKRRRQQQDMVRKAGRSTSQAAPESNIKLPEITIPGGRWFVLIPAAGLILLAVVLALRLLNPPETDTPPNAIWLNKAWSYAEHSDEELLLLSNELREHNIGTIYLETSTLTTDGTWSGADSGSNRFIDIEPQLETLIEQIRESYPNVELYAWIVVPSIAQGQNRLDRTQVQNSVASFSQRMIEQVGFDGILLDVKPIFEESEAYIDLLRTVKRQIGIETDLAVAVPADLSPTGTDLNLPGIIAGGTEWSAEYKRRVALLANQIVITAYNSYQNNPVDYIQWVTYQIDSYVAVLADLNSTTTVLIGVPNYGDSSDAHDPTIESLAAGLDAAVLAADALDDTTRGYFEGVAIYTDSLLTEADWTVYRQRWSR